MGNTYNKLDEKIRLIYLDNLKDLANETSATLNVYKEISEKAINKTRSLVVDILSAETVADYPLDWTRTSAMKRVSSSSINWKPDATFSNLDVTYEEMTFEVPQDSNEVDSIILQKLYVLNPIWQRVNLIMIGSDSNINITRTFIMLENTGGTIGNSFIKFN